MPNTDMIHVSPISEDGDAIATGKGIIKKVMTHFENAEFLLSNKQRQKRTTHICKNETVIKHVSQKLVTFSTVCYLPTL